MDALVPISGPEVIETKEIRGSSVLDMPPDVFQAGLDRRRINHKALIRWVAEALVEGTDFGKIHIVSKDKCDKGKWCKNENHFSKPVLFKPGSEKIAGMLGVIPTFPTLKDYEAAAVAGVKIETIVLRCELQDASGRVLAEGVGARSVSKDYGDINKSFKMAEKSGQIDATLRLGGLSEVFTQDLEDMVAQAEIMPQKAPEAVPEALDEDLTLPLEASIAKVTMEKVMLRDNMQEAADYALAALDGQTCEECNGELGAYVSKKGVPYVQCRFSHDLYFEYLDKGKTKQQASALTKGHFYSVIP